MPTVSQIEDTLRGWVLAALAGDTDRVIFADQGRARPARPYADIDVGAIEQRGRDELRGIASDGVREVVGARAVRATVSLYGSDAMQLAERVRSRLWLETVTDALRAGGVAFWRAEPVLDLTTEIETELEPRAAFDAFFGIASVQSEDVGFIECVEGTGAIFDPNGSQAAQTTFDTCVAIAVLTQEGEPLTEDGALLTEGP